MIPLCSNSAPLSGISLRYLLLALNFFTLTHSRADSRNLPKFDDDGGFYDRSNEDEQSSYEGTKSGVYRDNRDDIFTPIELLEVENIAKLMSEQLLQQFEDRTKFSALSEDLMSIPFDITEG